jgi:hypothetical protein
MGFAHAHCAQRRIFSPSLFMFTFLLDLSNSLRVFMAPPTNDDAVNILKRRCEFLEERLASVNEPKPKR